MPLTFDHGLCDTFNGLETLQHVLEQPFGLLQLCDQAAAIAIAAAPALAAQDVGVHAVDLQSRHGLGVDRHFPHRLDLAHDHIRLDIARIDAVELRPRARIELQDQFARGLQFAVAALAQTLDLREVAGGQEFQVRGHNGTCQRQRRLVVELPQLQEQGFSQVARGHTWRIAGLQELECGLQVAIVDLQFGRQERVDLGQGHAQVAIVVERFDQCGYQAAILRRQAHQRDLLQQVLTQGGTGGGYLSAR